METRFETDLLRRLMSATVQRAKVIEGNLANHNTPGFRRRVLRFEELLREALPRGEAEAGKIQPRIEADFVTPTREDGNNVTMELELSAMRENQLMFDTYAAIVETRGRILQHSLEGP